MPPVPEKTLIAIAAELGWEVLRCRPIRHDSPSTATANSGMSDFPLEDASAESLSARRQALRLQTREAQRSKSSRRPSHSPNALKNSEPSTRCASTPPDSNPAPCPTAQIVSGTSND